jgi:hypothetical protein
MSWTKRGLLFFVPIVIAIFTLEVGSYFLWNFMTEKRHGGVFMVKSIIGEVSINQTQTIVSHPYSLYWNNPLYVDEFGRQYDDDGYRSPVYFQQDRELRILVLGGSTTNSYPYVRDPKKIWTFQLQEILSKELQRPVHVFNAGLPYGTSAELMVHYLQSGRLKKPHLVIFHEGGNDIAPLLFPNYRTDYTHFRKSTAGGGRPFERRLLKNFYTLRVIYMVWLRGSSIGVYSSQPYSFKEVPRDQAVRMVTTNRSDAFESNLTTIVREAISNGSKVLLVGFLQAKEDFLSKNRPDIEGLEKAWVLGVEKHDRIMRNIAIRNNQTFLKLDYLRFDDSWFLDNCHLNEKGEAEKARQIAAQIIQNKI